MFSLVRGSLIHSDRHAPSSRRGGAAAVLTIGFTLKVRERFFGNDDDGSRQTRVTVRLRGCDVLKCMVWTIREKERGKRECVSTKRKVRARVRVRVRVRARARARVRVKVRVRSRGATP
jgi:hypothetical protein